MLCVDGVVPLAVPNAEPTVAPKVELCDRLLAENELAVQLDETEEPKLKTLLVVCVDAAVDARTEEPIVLKGNDACFVFNSESDETRLEVAVVEVAAEEWPAPNLNADDAEKTGTAVDIGLLLLQPDVAAPLPWKIRLVELPKIGASGAALTENNPLL